MAEAPGCIDKFYLLTLIHTLGRMREVNRLKWEDVDFTRGFVTLYTRKAKSSDLKPVRIPMNKDLREVLNKVPRTTEYVFPNPRTGKAYDHRDKLLKGLCEAAGVREFTYHCLRHFGASTLDNGGAPLTAMQSLLGHERPTTTDHYLQSLRGSAERSHQEAGRNSVICKGRGHYNRCAGRPRALRRYGADLLTPPFHTPNNKIGLAETRKPLFSNAPRVIRTPDLRIRSPALYPAELWAQT